LISLWQRGKNGEKKEKGEPSPCPLLEHEKGKGKRGADPLKYVGKAVASDEPRRGSQRKKRSLAFMVRPFAVCGKRERKGKGKEDSLIPLLSTDRLGEGKKKGKRIGRRHFEIIGRNRETRKERRTCFSHRASSLPEKKRIKKKKKIRGGVLYFSGEPREERGRDAGTELPPQIGTPPTQGGGGTTVIITIINRNPQEEEERKKRRKPAHSPPMPHVYVERPKKKEAGDRERCFASSIVVKAGLLR